MTTDNRTWPRLKHQYTVNELRAALAALVEADPAVGDQELLMEGPDGYEHWSGEFHHVRQHDGRRYVVAENYDDIWEREPPEGSPERSEAAR